MPHLSEIFGDFKVTYNYHLPDTKTYVSEVAITEEAEQDSVLLEEKIKELILSIEDPSRVSKLEFENIPERFPFEELSRFEDLKTLSFDKCSLTNGIEDIESIVSQLQNLSTLDLSGNIYLYGILRDNSPLGKLDYLNIEGTSIRTGEGLKKKIKVVRED